MEIIRLTSDDELPISLEDLKLDLRVDDDDEDGTLERNQRTAAAMIEVRSGAIIVPGTFEVFFDYCEPIRVPRFPLRRVTGIAAMTSKGQWTELDLEDFRVLVLEKGFRVEPYPGFTPPQFYMAKQSLRLRFSAGYGEPATGESEGDTVPLTDLYRGALTAITGSLFENRGLGEADAQFKVEQSMAGILNAIRTFW